MSDKKSGIQVNLLDFDNLVKETVKNSKKLMEYFRSNWIYYQLISGEGLEFDKIKQYVPGLDPRRMDWKIYARSGKLYVRTYKEEKEFNIVIILDVSNSMLLGSSNYTKNEFASIIAGIISFAATESGDTVSGGVYSSQNKILLDPDPEYYNLLHILSEKQNYGGEKDWNMLANDLISNYSSDSIIFIISDFINTNPDKFIPDLAENFSKVYGIMIRDPLDNQLPAKVGKMYLKDPETNQVVLTDLTALKKEYEELNLELISKMREFFHQHDQLFFTLLTGEDFATSFVKAMGEEQVIIS